VTRPHIDLHCHYIPPAIIDLIAKDGAAHSVTMTDDGRVSFADRSQTQRFPRGMVDLEDRLSWMDEREIDVQVLSAWMDFSTYVLDGEDGAWLARSLNELTVEAVAHHADRFRTMATVPLQTPEAAAEELRYAIDELGMAAVEIATSIREHELDHAGLEPFWMAADQLNALVLVHPLHASLGYERLSRSYFLDNIVSNPAEATVAAANIIFGGVLERHPQLKICLTHGGGFLPYQVGRQDRGYAARSEVTGLHVNSPPSSFLGRFYYDTIVHDPHALAFLIDRVGAPRVVLGSDYPFPMGDPNPVETVRAAGLEADVATAVLGVNATTALGRNA
jgi:aminocarboxymuconate-semialdehyde decarboxylase